MKRILLFVLLAAVALLASADAPNGSGTYYQNADGKKAATLKTALCGIIYNRTVQSYDGLWTAFFTTDVRSDGKIWDMYSNITNYTPVTSGSSYSVEGDCYNREHSFPQSWFGSNTPMYTDLHHMYPTDGKVNGMRANYPFGETNGETYQSANGFSKLGSCTYSGYSGKVFEPNDEYKGDFARTYFYMVTCYEEKLHDWYTNYGSTDVVHVIDGTTYPAFQTWQLNMLLEWATNDPVSAKETARNNAVYGIQLNRNPFIDYPGLEQYIWGNKTDVAFSYDNYVQPDGSSSGSGTGSGSGGDEPDPGTDPGDDPTLAAGTYKLTITASDFVTGGYTPNNKEKTSTAVCTTDASKTFEVKWKSYNICLDGSRMQWKSGSGYLYNITDLGTIKSVTVTAWSDQGEYTTYYGIAEAPSVSTEVGGGFFKTVVGSTLGQTSSVEVVFTIAGGDTPDPNPDPVDEGGYFTKLTSMDNFEDGGTYLIVCESESKAFNGALDVLDAVSNNISVTIADNKIEATPTIMASTFTIATKKGGYSIKSASGYYIGRTAKSNGLNTSKSDSYTNDIQINKVTQKVYIESIEISSTYLYFNALSGQERFRYFTSTQKDIQLYKYIAPAATSQIVEIGEAGYATMVAKAIVSVPEGVEAYAAQVNAGSTSVHLEQVEASLPKGAAVVLKGAAGTYEFPFVASAASDMPTNDLKASDGTVTGDGTTIYALGVGKTGAYAGKAGFYIVKEDVLIPEGKAYLEVTTASGGEAPEFYGFSDEDDATAISDELRVKSEEMEGAAYNLAGQRVDNSKLPHGIYIVGGRKVLK